MSQHANLNVGAVRRMPSVAFGVAYALTGDIVIGGAVALIEPAVNTVGDYTRHTQVFGRDARPSHPSAALCLLAIVGL